MKTFLILSICSIATVGGLVAQSPSVSPAASVPAPSATASASPSGQTDTEQAIRKKLRKHFNFTIGDNNDSTEGESDKKHHDGSDDIPAMVIPLVGIVFLTIFGAPVLIVAIILYFGFSKGRMQHKTIRMMVEKGQPVPAELLAPPAPAVRQRSDMRRGVVLSMIGLGLMLWLGAVNDWEGGAWSLGLIPFLIGAGYLMVWKLEGGKPKGDNPPPLP